MVVIEVCARNTPVVRSAHRYKAFTGMVPFNESTPITVGVDVLNGNRPERPTDPNFSDEFWNLTVRCWDHTPRRRPDISEIVRNLGSGFTPQRGGMTPGEFPPRFSQQDNAYRGWKLCFMSHPSRCLRIADLSGFGRPERRPGCPDPPPTRTQSETSGRKATKNASIRVMFPPARQTHHARKGAGSRNTEPALHITFRWPAGETRYDHLGVMGCRSQI